MFTYILCTLFDITATGVLSYKVELDNLKQRNQQRNWQVISQLIQLRSQPLHIAEPGSILTDVNRLRFGSNYQGQHRVWCSWWSVEYQDLYTDGNDVSGVLLKDFDQIPMLTGLYQTADLSMPMLITRGQNCNICFYTRESWDNTMFKIDFDIVEAK